SLPGPDHAASLEPAEFSLMVQAIRHIEAALGSPVKAPQPVEEDVRLAARKSIILKVARAAGERIDESHLVIQRPGNGIPPRYLPAVSRMRAARDLPADTVLTWGDVQP